MIVLGRDYMYVYRCLSSYDDYINSDVVLGRNTHTYDVKNYIHFFRYSQFCQYYFSLFNQFKKRYSYFMVADIDREVLNKYIGFGYYYFDDLSLAGNHILPNIEYAFPVDLFDDRCVLSIDKCIPSQYASNYLDYHNYIFMLSYYAKIFHYDFDRLLQYFHASDLEELLRYDYSKCLKK